MGNYAYCLQNISIFHDPIREKPVLSCFYLQLVFVFLNIVLAYFQPHSDTDCNLCNISIANHRKLTIAHSNFLIRNLVNISFVDTIRENQGT